MDNPYAELNSNFVTRNFGGTKIGVAEPLVTGYHFIFFSDLPPYLSNYYTKERAVNGRSNLDIPEIQTILSAAALAVTTPGGRLNKIEFTGLGGIKWAVPGNIDYDTALSIKFLEFNKTPIFGIIHSWIQMIRDYRSGVASLGTASEDSYSKSNYAATVYYFTTTPDMNSINYYACYDGVFPVSDPQQLFGSDVENIGKLEVEIEFNIDYIWTEPWVLTRCQSYLTDRMTNLQSVMGRDLTA